MGENKGLWIGIVAVGLAATGVGLYLNSHKAPPPVEAPVSAPAQPIAPPPTAPSMPLPSLAGSDAFMRDKAGALSSDKSWADWLKQSDLVRRSAAATEIVANGKLPKDAFEFLIPHAKFTVTKTAGKVYVDPRSYGRYDAEAAAIASVDAKAAAALFTAAKPLFNEAYGEVGRRGVDIQDTLVRDIKSLLAVPEVDGMVRLRSKVVTWAMTDDKLESLSAPQKVILRMGPKNGPKVQAKLREFAAALGVPDDQLPKAAVYHPKAD